MSHREVLEGEQKQGVGESIAYVLAVNASTGVPSSVTSVTVYEYNPSARSYKDVTAAVMPTGSASLVGQNITLPLLTNLVDGGTYRVDVKYVVSGNSLIDYFWVQCER